MFEWIEWTPEVIVGVTLGSLLLLVIVVVSAMCVQAGLFHTINIRTTQPEFGELLVMYKSGRGAYSESGAMFSAAHSLMPQYNCIGVYYDDPEKNSSENLRYVVGLVLAESGAEANAEDMALLQSNGYRRAVFPAVKHAVVTDFPYTSTLSCIFAVFRVYPALREYVERRELCAHPILELYDNKSRRILFMGPLEQQSSFYVPEVLDDNLVSSPGEDEDSCDTEGRDTDEDESPTHDDADQDKASVQDTNTWEKSASLLAEGSEAEPKTTNVIPGSAEESDTNTGSSFEEIDASETADQPQTAAAPTSDDAVPTSQQQEPVSAATTNDTKPVSSGQCDATAPVSSSQCGVTAPVSSSQCDVAAPVSSEQCDAPAPVSAEQCDITAPVSSEKCIVTAPVSSEKCIVTAPASSEQCNVTSLPVSS